MHHSLCARSVLIRLVTVKWADFCGEGIRYLNWWWNESMDIIFIFTFLFSIAFVLVFLSLTIICMARDCAYFNLCTWLLVYDIDRWIFEFFALNIFHMFRSTRFVISFSMIIDWLYLIFFVVCGSLSDQTHCVARRFQNPEVLDIRSRCHQLAWDIRSRYRGRCRSFNAARFLRHKASSIRGTSERFLNSGAHLSRIH